MVIPISTLHINAITFRNLKFRFSSTTSHFAGHFVVQINKGQTRGPLGYDVNVLPVWKKGITGKGVIVCILDDGIDHTHLDLIDNYVSMLNANL